MHIVKERCEYFVGVYDIIWEEDVFDLCSLD